MEGITKKRLASKEKIELAGGKKCKLHGWCDINELHLRSKKPEYECKSCRREYRKIHYLNNKELYKIKAKNWQKLNREKRKVHTKKYRLNNKEKINEQQKKYREANKIAIRISARMRRLENKENINSAARKYRCENKERINAKQRERYKINYDKMHDFWKKYRACNREKYNKYREKWRKNNPTKIDDCYIMKMYEIKASEKSLYIDFIDLKRQHLFLKRKIKEKFNVNHG